jgi:hypothetical protein
LLLCTAMPAAAAGQARGFVFEDADSDGVRDAGEPGVAGVAVSNGLDVVQTAEDGSYQIALAKNAILFITKPAAYDLPLDERGLPLFYYRHYPKGTPEKLELHFRGIEPSGPLPESINFSLHRGELLENFEAILLADPQPKSAKELGYFRDDVVAELVGSGAAFGITLGDIMYDILASYPRYIEIVGQIGIPWLHLPGNHDVNSEAPDDERSLETYKSHFGPSYYSFDYGQAHFIALDSVNYLGKKGSRKLAHDGENSKYEGWIVDRQLTWLKNDLALVPAAKLIVLAMHIPLEAYGDRGRTRGVVGNTAAVLDLLEAREHVMAIAGHLHSTQHHYLGERLHMHVLTTACGSWWSGPKDERGIPVAYQEGGTPNGYHLMSVEGNSATIRFKAANEPADFQLRVWLEEGSIVVNLFDGGPRSTVEYQLDDGEALAMERVYRNDPFIDDLFERTKKSWKSWIDIDPSPHLWVAPLPENLGPGVHTIKVRAVDEYGRVHTGSRIYEQAP